MTALNLIKRWINVWAKLWQSALRLLRFSVPLLQTQAGASLKALIKSGPSCRAELRNRKEERAKYYRAVTRCRIKSKFKCVIAKWNGCLKKRHLRGFSALQWQLMKGYCVVCREDDNFSFIHEVKTVNRPLTLFTRQLSLLTIFWEVIFNLLSTLYKLEYNVFYI